MTTGRAAGATVAAADSEDKLPGIFISFAVMIILLFTVADRIYRACFRVLFRGMPGLPQIGTAMERTATRRLMSSPAYWLPLLGGVCLVGLALERLHAAVQPEMWSIWWVIAGVILGILIPVIIPCAERLATALDRSARADFLRIASEQEAAPPEESERR